MALLNSQQLANAKAIRSALEAQGITNQFAQDAILVVSWKETGLYPIVERCYNNTANSTIRRLFGIYVKDLSEEQLTALKKDCVAFFNKVYGNRIGNSATEGYKYRGRSFIQITGKANYKNVGDAIGVDLVSDPDKLLQPAFASKSLAIFYKNRFSSKTLSNLYKVKNLNEFKDFDTALKAIFHLTAGEGNSQYKLFTEDSTGGWKKVQDFKERLLSELKQKTTEAPNYIIMLLIGLGLFGYANRKMFKK